MVILLSVELRCYYCTHYSSEQLFDREEQIGFRIARKYGEFPIIQSTQHGTFAFKSM